MVTWDRFNEAFKNIHDAIRSGIASAPEGKTVTKIGFWEDAEGRIRYIKFYSGAELLYTLTFSNADEVYTETWNITRT